ncbi:hypothetical protein R1sor_022965 [Riccia sorocarpa]|uniref:Integrase catalytic domain-containing protein n=1 Tax=Riccia sorocarpa TaxID=122646 RepID=A0ABD3GNK1_9MARC
MSKGPILRPPRWDMIFHIHTDASGVAVGAVLAQPQDPKLDMPIYFANRTLNKSERDYTTIEREALAMVYDVKKFKSYLQGNKFVFFVDHQALTYLVNKVHITGRIARWLLLLQEFDFTVIYKPGKINVLADQLSRIELGKEPEYEDDSFPDEHLLNIDLEEPDEGMSSGNDSDDTTAGDKETYEELLKRGWQTPLRYFLAKGRLPDGTPYHIRKKTAQKIRQYTLINRELYKKGIDLVLRRYVNEEDIQKIPEDAHEGPSGGHGAGDATARKILHTGLWWPGINKDCHNHVKTCNECQRSSILKEGMPLKPVLPLGVFQKWGLDFIGPIKPASFPTGKRCIITATDYTTRWVEAECYRTNDKKVTAKFIYENIITRFGVPLEFVSDQGGHFLNGVIEELVNHYQVKHRFSTQYYPQCNGQAESTNKILIVVLRKLVERHPMNWDASVPSVLWAMRTAYKATTNHTPFHLVYGIEALVPMEFIVPTLRISTEYQLNHEDMMNRRLKELLELEEKREMAFENQCRTQLKRKKYIDGHRKIFNFKKDDKVLHCVATGKIKRRKLTYIWEGPFNVDEVSSNGNILISNEDKTDVRLDVRKVYPDGKMNDPDENYYFPDRREVFPDRKFNYPEGGWYHPEDQRNLLDGKKYLPDQEAAQRKSQKVTKPRSGLGVLAHIKKTRAYTQAEEKSYRHFKANWYRPRGIDRVASAEGEGVITRTKGRAEEIKFVAGSTEVREQNWKRVYRIHIEQKLLAQSISPYQYLENTEAVIMGRKPAAVKLIEESEDSTLPESQIVASASQIAGQKTFGCYKKEFEQLE